MFVYNNINSFYVEKWIKFYKALCLLLQRFQVANYLLIINVISSFNVTRIAVTLESLNSWGQGQYQIDQNKILKNIVHYWWSRKYTTVFVIICAVEKQTNYVLLVSYSCANSTLAMAA